MDHNSGILALRIRRQLRLMPELVVGGQQSAQEVFVGDAALPDARDLGRKDLDTSAQHQLCTTSLVYFGYRERDWQTRLGELVLMNIPKLRQGSYLPCSWSRAGSGSGPL